MDPWQAALDESFSSDISDVHPLTSASSSEFSGDEDDSPHQTPSIIEVVRDEFNNDFSKFGASIIPSGGDPPVGRVYPYTLHQWTSAMVPSGWVNVGLQSPNNKPRWMDDGRRLYNQVGIITDWDRLLGDMQVVSRITGRCTVFPPYVDFVRGDKKDVDILEGVTNGFIVVFDAILSPGGGWLGTIKDVFFNHFGLDGLVYGPSMEGVSVLAVVTRVCADGGCEDDYPGVWLWNDGRIYIPQAVGNARQLKMFSLVRCQVTLCRDAREGRLMKYYWTADPHDVLFPLGADATWDGESGWNWAKVAASLKTSDNWQLRLVPVHDRPFPAYPPSPNAEIVLDLAKENGRGYLGSVHCYPADFNCWTWKNRVLIDNENRRRSEPGYRGSVKCRVTYFEGMFGRKQAVCVTLLKDGAPVKDHPFMTVE